jgi:predicted membrane channel-forming protein YqfA (hemolysin III family)
MRFNAPTQVFVIISVVLAGIALLSRLAVIQGVTANAFWLLLAGYIALLIGVIYKRR